MRKAFSIRSLFFFLMLLGMSSASFAQIGVSITIAPPELPVYEQPICPGDGYIWTPGYWAWDGDDYYWVPGTWVEAPEVGYLWTPPYWGWETGGYLFHEGYWGPHVGFYGGISYGFGYFGEGYEGGRWDGGHFFYNRAVNNVNVTVIHNTYNTTINERNVTRVSFNGGNGGIQARATAQDEAAARDRHVAPVAAQQQHFQQARSNPELRASSNHGAPPVAATSKPGDFKGGVVAGRGSGTPYNATANRGGNGNRSPAGNEARQGNTPESNANANNGNGGKPTTYSHVKDLPPSEKPVAPNTGNAKQDQKYQQQQQKLQAKQDQERQKLQAQQEKDHQKLTQQKANDVRQQQVEQKHQQQTQQLQQRHTQQQQQLQQRAQPRPAPAPRPAEHH